MEICTIKMFGFRFERDSLPENYLVHTRMPKGKTLNIMACSSMVVNGP